MSPLPLVDKAEEEVVSLVGVIDYELARSFVSRVVDYATDSPPPKRILIPICSPGGDIDATLACATAIQFAQHRGVEVVGIVIGICMSGALSTLCACDHRQAVAASIFMEHGMKIDLSGSAIDHTIFARLTALYTDALVRLVVPRTPLHDEEFWRAIMASGDHHYMSTAEALEMGLIDEIIGG